MVFLIFSISLTSCENKLTKPGKVNPELHITERKNLTATDFVTDIVTDIVTDTVKSTDQVKKNYGLLFDIEGNYTFTDDISECKFHLSLFYRDELLKYNIETNTRKHLGNAKVDLNEEKDGYYITFLNIEWSEYLGGIDLEVETTEDDLSLPQDIVGVLYENEITIQNYGNAMNYYVQLGACDVKYIHLIK